MKRSTMLQTLDLAQAVGAVVGIGLLWSWWAALWIVGVNLVSVVLDKARRSLVAGGE